MSHSCEACPIDRGSFVRRCSTEYDSNSLGRLSNGLDDEEEEEESPVVKETEDTQRQNERLALEKARFSVVAFAVRTNVTYIPSAQDHSPLMNRTVSFCINDCLHIKEVSQHVTILSGCEESGNNIWWHTAIKSKYNADWWIGRVVKIRSDVGFLPSPQKLAAIRQQKIHGLRHAKLRSTLSSNLASYTIPGNYQQTTRSLSLSTPITDNDIAVEDCDDVDARNVEPPNASSTNEKTKPFFKKMETPPYEVVPSIRPIILIGPSLKGYEVTDMMQKPLFDFLRRKFDGRITVTHVTADISLAKRTVFGRGGLAKRPAVERGNSRTSYMEEVEEEVEHIFQLSHTMNQLILLDCDTINHPSQLLKSSLAPILVYLKISSTKVLQRLIKSRTGAQSRNMNVQIVAAEKLNQCHPEMFDVILDENHLETACEHLAEYLENYWEATHPVFTTQHDPWVDKLPNYSCRPLKFNLRSAPCSAAPQTDKQNLDYEREHSNHSCRPLQLQSSDHLLSIYI